MKIDGNFCRPQKLLFILLYFLSICNIVSQEKNHIDFNSPENTLKFADYLFCDNDYTRAISEFGKYLAYHNNDTVLFKIALSYSNIGDLNSAEIAYKQLFSNTPFSDAAKLEIARLYFRNKKYSELNMITYNPLYMNSRFYSSIKILNNITLLSGNNSIQHLNMNEFINSFPESAREDMQKFFLQKMNPPYKNPVYAAVLSTLIPGSGKIYTGYYGDGITAFILSGILGYTSYSNFKADHIFRGWLFGSLAGVFYLGNIYGSAVSAQIRNAEVNLNFKIKFESFLNKYNYFLPDENYFCK